MHLDHDQNQQLKVYSSDALSDLNNRLKFCCLDRFYHFTSSKMPDYSWDPKTGTSKPGNIQKPDILTIRILNGSKTRLHPKPFVDRTKKSGLQMV